MKKTLSFYRPDISTKILIPYADQGVKAGFPSPAQDYITLSIDLNQELVKHPATTFFAKVSGDSMKDANIQDGDILIIDRSLSPSNNDIAVCFLDGDFTVKCISIEKDHIWLVPSNDLYEPIKVTEENNFIIWGVVTYVIKKAKIR